MFTLLNLSETGNHYSDSSEQTHSGMCRDEKCVWDQRLIGTE